MRSSRSICRALNNISTCDFSESTEDPTGKPPPARPSTSEMCSLADEIELKAHSFLNFSCGGCGEELKSKEIRKSCSACKLARYCSEVCQKNAWPTHKGLCKEAKALLSLGPPESRKRSFTALAIDCERAVRCLEVLLQPNPKEKLHPLQYYNMLLLRTACNFIEHGQMPPEPLPCFNPVCKRPAELVEFANELELREFVITGLCASCQTKAYEDALRIAGPSCSEPEPLETTPVDMPPMIWTDSCYIGVLEGMPLYSRTTIWDEEGRPCWVAGEILSVRCVADRRENMVLQRESQLGRDVAVPLRTFRRLAAANHIQSAFAITPEMSRGVVHTRKVILALGAFETWVPFLQLARVARLDAAEFRLQETPDADRFNSNAGGGGQAFRTLFMIMHEDAGRRAAGTFAARYAPIADGPPLWAARRGP
jgi:hypothetical protein